MQLEMSLRPPMTKIDPDLIAKQASMSKALALCQTLSGKDDAQFYGEGRIVKDQGQWSRIMGPTSRHCFPHEKLNLFMDLAGNEAPMLWLIHSRGYDLASLRKLQTETERLLEAERARRIEAENKLAYAESLIKGRAAS